MYFITIIYSYLDLVVVILVKRIVDNLGFDSPAYISKD
jgi:hypothetical protein